MRAYERLLKYARVYTTSDPNSGTHPSAEREFDLAHILVEDMKAIGIEDAFVDEHCYVYGTLPATPGCEDKPALGLLHAAADAVEQCTVERAVGVADFGHPIGISEFFTAFLSGHQIKLFHKAAALLCFILGVPCTRCVLL